VGSSIKDLRKTKKYPCQNLSLANLPGEIWKDVEGYEDYYQVSDKGRVKAFAKYIEFHIPGRHTVRYWRDERVFRQGKRKQWNGTVKEYTYNLSVTFCVDQKMDTRSVSRLVYETFKEKIDSKRDDHLVIHKDGDHFNNRINNLQLSGRSAIHKSSYSKKRAISAFKGMDMTPFLARRSGQLKKKITQYDLQGKRLMTFNSMQDAWKATGIHPSNIAVAAKGKKLSMSGFIWRYGKGPARIDVSAFKKAKLAIKEKMCRRVSQYNMNGDRLNVFQSIKEAAGQNNILASAIQRAVAGKYITAGGFIWRYGQGNKKIDTSDSRARIANRTMGRAKSVMRYTLNGKTKRLYKSLVEAARDTGCSADTIGLTAKNPGKIYKGYKWKFV